MDDEEWVAAAEEALEARERTLTHAAAPEAPRPRSAGDRATAPCSWAGEEMLESIDRLYNQLLGAPGDEEASRSPGAAGGSTAHADAYDIIGRTLLPATAAAAHSHAALVADETGFDDGAESAPIGEPEGEVTEEDAAALLENIDRLYSQMLSKDGGDTAGDGGLQPAVHEGRRDEDDLVEEAGEDAEGAEGDGDGEEDELAEATAEDLREVLHETLWSALLAGRAAGSTPEVQKALLQTLPQDVLGQCLRATQVDSGAALIPGSLSRGLAAELPDLHAAMQAATAAPEGDELSLPALVRLVRQARDGVLSMAYESKAAASSAQEAPKPMAARFTVPPVRLKAPLPPRPPPLSSSATPAAGGGAAAGRRSATVLGGRGAQSGATTPQGSAAPSSRSGASVAGPAAAAPMGCERTQSKRPPRKSSMSYWTFDDLDDDLEAQPAPTGASRLLVRA
eukprot:CAMPEP_0170280138 /NCGR_PEP_ID=MMETSP0116_2-20130129/40080_1 /TAXON_ID=400756 /ORGANISM="Durinskia baltica, Strain CSIRO CS-38" /LENGTH=452 /DNA_ID=CAMNT_0010531463 /DNA_START=1 /DNA_END=1359 /DNA_ORIENTATION=-